ncbi:MAG: SpoIIE family protein phosphatase, partial [Pseudobdellovibrionaceae bacterium]
NSIIIKTAKVIIILSVFLSLNIPLPTVFYGIILNLIYTPRTSSVGSGLHISGVSLDTDFRVKKRGLSIRYKILFLLTSVPLLTLSAYLYLATHIFEDDKIAYVFDSSSSVSSSIAAQVKSQLNEVLSTTRPLFQDYLTTTNFSESSKAIFQNDFGLDYFVVFQKNTQSVFEKTKELEKSPGLGKDIFTQLQNQWPALLALAEKEHRVVRAPFHDDRIFIFEKVLSSDKKSSLIFLVVSRLSELSEVFKNSKTQKMFLIDQGGGILSGPQESFIQKLSEIVPLKFMSGNSLKTTQGTEKAVTKTGEELLVSFSKVGFADLYIVSLIKKSVALSAVGVLIRKSILFFLILIFVTVIVSLFASNSLTSALTDLFDATKRVAEGRFDIQVKVSSNDEVGSLADNFNLMAAEVSRLLDETAEKARMQTELQTAKTVQETLFPEAKARIGNLWIAGYYEPASECGGDWWHYCNVGDQIFLWIGDATGHGAPAALITSAAKSASSIIEKLVNITPAQALELLNRSIYDVSKGRIMMTFFLAAYNPKTGTLTYSNASHEAPYLLQKKEGPVKKKDLVPLNEVNNPRLGQARDTKYSETTVQLEDGDTVFFYTDGIPDICNPGGEHWGEREFIKHLVLVQQNNPSSQQVVDQFVEYFQKYRQGAQLIDDVTFFMIKKEKQYYGEV